MKKTLATHLMVSLHCFFQFQNRTFCRFPEWHLLMDVKLREFFNSFNVICHIALIVNSNLTSLEFNVFFNKHFCFILCSFPPWFISQKSTFLSPFFFLISPMFIDQRSLFSISDIKSKIWRRSIGLANFRNFLVLLSAKLATSAKPSLISYNLQ